MIQFNVARGVLGRALKSRPKTGLPPSPSKTQKISEQQRFIQASSPPRHDPKGYRASANVTALAGGVAATIFFGYCFFQEKSASASESAPASSDLPNYYTSKEFHHKRAVDALREKHCDDVKKLISFYDLPVEKLAEEAARQEEYEFIKYLIEEKGLSPQVQFFREVYGDFLPFSSNSHTVKHSLLYRVIEDVNKKNSKELWEFVNYLLEKGADFTSKETGLYNSPNEITTGEKCLGILIHMRKTKEVETLIEVSKGRLGSNAVNILKEQLDRLERNCKRGGEWEKGIYLKNKPLIESFIAKLEALEK